MDQDLCALSTASSRCDIIQTLDYNVVEWLNQRPKEVVELFSRLCQTSADDKSGAYKIAKAIEQVYGARSSRLVLPLSFRHNLMAYSLSGSKLLVQLNASWMPGGSYSFIKSSLEQNAKNELAFPSGMVRVVFDNEQVVGKRYSV